jgi:hypothetical protein
LASGKGGTGDATGTDDSATDWIFDYIVAFLKSPPWTTPLCDFLDENCIVFDADAENKLEYTHVHKVRPPTDLADRLTDGPTDRPTDRAATSNATSRKMDS